MKKRIFSFFMAVISLFMVCSSVVYASSDYVKTVEFISTEDNENLPVFEQNIEKDGVSYTLSEVQYEELEKRPVEETKYFTKVVESVISKEEVFIPEEVISENGISYQLKDVQQEEIQGLQVVERTVSGYTDYTDAVSQQDIPKTKTISSIDPVTKKSVETVCELQNVVQAGAEWYANSIKITFFNIGAEVYEWNGIMVPGDSDMPLYGYEEELLQSVGADPSSRVLDVYWTSEPYQDEQGQICRDAMADIEEYVIHYRANYSKQLKTENSGIKYTAVYEGSQTVKSDTSFVYKKQAKAVYKKTSSPHMLQYVLTGAGILLLIILIVAVLYILTKHRKKDSKKERKK